MLKKINNDIKNINKKINENDANINKYFELLDNINSQASEVQQNIEKLQLENQASNKEIKRLEIVKEYLEEVKEEGGTENEQ